MAKKVATSKQTGGGGFDFEDKVAAWFIADLLNNSYPLWPIKAKLTQIYFQVRPDGWLLDDLLLILQTEESTVIRVPVTVKSNIQFSSNGPNEELRRDLWEQYLNDVSGVYNADSDFLGVVNSTLASGLSTDINKLINAAKEGEPSKLQERIDKGQEGSFSETQIKIFNGFKCPQDLATKHNVTDENTWDLLSRIIFLEFDFDKATSKDENKLIEKCRESLSYPDGKEEVGLYEKLASVRKTLAPKEGAFIDFEKILNEVRWSYNLSELKDYNDDWEKVEQICIASLDRVKDTIGGKVSIEQTAELKELEEVTDKNKLVFLLGESGYGKTSLCKKFVLNSKTKFIWLDARSIESGNITGYFDLNNSIIDLINQAREKEYTLIVDGIDRFMKQDQIRLITDLLPIAAQPNSPWKVIISCQTDDHENVLRSLYKNNVEIESYSHILEPIERKNLVEVESTFPAISGLFKHEHLSKILSNLKYLDLLAYNLRTEGVAEIDESFGESQIIDWIWEEEVKNTDNANGDQRSKFLQQVATEQAEKLNSGIPVSNFEVGDLSPVPSLKEDKILYEEEDKLFFSHDLISDWARYKLIRSNDGDLKSFLKSKNLLSPLWGKAIRLYAVYLLEKDDNGTEWTNKFKLFSEAEPKEKIIQDLFLEAILFTSSTGRDLESVWPFFKENDGAILTRFLDRFLIRATRPNPQILLLAKQLGGYSKAEASSIHRTPIYQYWPSVLVFLHNHVEEVVQLSKKKLAIVSELWLTYTSYQIPFRKEAAFCAYKNAEWMFNFKIQENSWVQDDVDEVIFSAMLLGVQELPEEIKDLSLKLCRRTQFDRPKKEEKEERPLPKSMWHLSNIREQQQWKHGPYERVDEAFSKVCLNSSSLNNMIDSHPETAKEIILACLIEHPRPVSSYDSFHYKLDIDEPRNWFPPFYSHGPFSYFLSRNSEVAINLILDLVNFATQQWRTVRQNKETESSSVIIETDHNNKEYYGDERVYFWYRNVGNVSTPIPTALMSLEKFLIDRIDNDEPISEYIAKLFEGSDSVSILGVLSSIGRYKVSLFRADLKPLLGCFELYDWEKSLDYGGHNIEGHQMIGSVDFGKEKWEQAKEWNSLPHRKYSIVRVAIQLFLNSAELDEFYQEATNKWRDDLIKIESEGEIDVYRTNLIAQFNKENYKAEKHGDQYYYVFNEPKDITEKLTSIREEVSEVQDVFFLPYQFLKYIEEGKEFSLDEIQELYQKVTGFESKYRTEGGREELVFGGFAVIATNRQVWEEIHPEYDDRILDFTEHVLDNAPAQLNELYMMDTGSSWQSFCTSILATYWINDPANERIRKLTALLIVKSSYDITEKLFEQISKHCNWSNQSFIQLQNLVIQWSSGVYRYYQIPRDEWSELPKVQKTRWQKFVEFFRKSNDSEDEFDISKYADSIINDYINDKSPKNLLSWRKLRIDIPKRSRHSWRNSNKSIGRESGILTEWIHHAYSSLPSLEDCRDDEEYMHVLSIWSQVVDQIVFEIGDIQEGSEVFDEYPQDFELWAVKGIAKIITQIKPNDNSSPESFWMPLFEYGYFAPHFVENLITWFFIENIEDKAKHSSFHAEWMKMYKCASESENWRKIKSFRGQGVWETLIGISNSQLRWWSDDHRDFLKPISKQILEHINTRKTNQDVINGLLILMRKKSGIDFIHDGVIMVDEYLKIHLAAKKVGAPEGYVFQEFRHNDSLAKTIGHLWENHSSEIKNTPSTFLAFKNIVLYLVSIQNSIGLELQSDIIDT